MSVPSNGVVDASLDAQAAAPVLSAARPLYWSVRRELWENRSIYIAPLVVAAVFMFGYLLSTIRLPERRRAALLLDAAQQRAAIAKPFEVAAMVIIVTGLIVAVFYCLDALYGERRDRSILFWKSLPVSDLTTVLSKASIPLVVLPVLVFGITVTTQLVMLLLNSVVLLANGMSAALTWKHFPLFPQSLILLYGLTVHALWHAPIYAWLLLVSVWARRTPLLWAVLPPLAIGVVERVAFNTSYFGSLLRYRVAGAMARAFALEGDGQHIDRLSLLDPLKFLGSPGLWSGLLFAAAFLVAAARLRRHRDPI